MKVRYNSYPYFPPATVERLEPGQVTKDLAGQCLATIAAAYTMQFEDRLYYKEPLPTGSVMRHFQPEKPERIAANQERMLRSMDEGSVYWIFRSPRNQVCALTKVTPTRSQVAVSLGQKRFDELYLNDAITHPQSRNRHLASMTLHAALRCSDAGDTSRLTLDGYDGSTVNGWVKHLGFEQVGPVNEEDPFTIGDYALPQIRFATPSGTYKSEVLSGMEMNRPWLQNFTAIGS